MLYREYITGFSTDSSLNKIASKRSLPGRNLRRKKPIIPGGSPKGFNVNSPQCNWGGIEAALTRTTPTGVEQILAYTPK